MTQPIIVRIPDEDDEEASGYDWVWPLAILVVIAALIFAIHLVDPSFLAPLFALFGIGG